MKIEVFKKRLDLANVMMTFTNKQGFLDWKEKCDLNLYSDQIAINGFIYWHWDQFEQALERLK